MARKEGCPPKSESILEKPHALKGNPVRSEARVRGGGHSCQIWQVLPSPFEFSSVIRFTMDSQSPFKPHTRKENYHGCSLHYMWRAVGCISPAE